MTDTIDVVIDLAWLLGLLILASLFAAQFRSWRALRRPAAQDLEDDALVDSEPEDPVVTPRRRVVCPACTRRFEAFADPGKLVLLTCPSCGLTAKLPVRAKGATNDGPGVAAAARPGPAPALPPRRVAFQPVPASPEKGVPQE